MHRSSEKSFSFIHHWKVYLLTEMILKIKQIHMTYRLLLLLLFLIHLCNFRRGGGTELTLIFWHVCTCKSLNLEQVSFSENRLFYSVEKGRWIQSTSANCHILSYSWLICFVQFTYLISRVFQNLWRIHKSPSGSTPERSSSNAFSFLQIFEDFLRLWLGS